ncbi:MAG: peptide ABC transporter substrate-binding protein [Chlamydiia bacterium]|nr:peptide ABC transporter substrate-binding protein [Chlamydiia bacterium]
MSQVGYFSFFEAMGQASPQHAKLFKVLEKVAEKGSFESSEASLSAALFLLRNTDKAFIDRRSEEFFVFLIKKLGQMSSLSKNMKESGLAHLTHLIAFPYQQKKVTGFIVDLAGIRGDIQEVVAFLCKNRPEIVPVNNGSFFYVNPKDNRTILYFELQHVDKELSAGEINEIKEELKNLNVSAMIPTCSPIPSLESSIKTLRWLMKELERGDIPQVMINHDLQTTDKLYFTVYVCQITEPTAQSAATLFSFPHVEVQYQFRDQVGDYLREGFILRIELSYSPSHSLVEKRYEVAHFVETCMGSFRDVNGGLLEKIESNFNALADIFPSAPKDLRDFFDSITPEDERAICAPQILKELYLTTQEKVDGAIVEKRLWIGATIKVDEKEVKPWKDALIQSMPHLKFAKVFAANGVIISSFLPHPSPNEAETFKTAITEELKRRKDKMDATRVLRLCSTVSFSSFDPRTGAGEQNSYLHSLLFEGLMRIGPEGKVEPAIAEKVTLSLDKKRYTFHLRKSYWSNGLLLTAHDFLYSWQMILTRKDLAPLSYLFDGIENAQKIKENQAPLSALGVKAIDDQTLLVQLESPCIPFLENCTLTLFSPICKVIDEKEPSWSESQGKGYVCNGPFSLEKKEADGSLTLQKNPYYWEKEKTYADRITIPIVSKEEGRKLFLNKEVDALVYFLYKRSFPMDFGEYEIGKIKGATTKRFLCFNCLEPPFHNAKMRKAIAYALDRKKIAHMLEHDIAPSATFFSSFPCSENSEQRGCMENIHEAQQFLIQAIVEDSSVRNTFFNQTLTVSNGLGDFADVLCNYLNSILHLNWKPMVLKPTDSLRYFKRKRSFQISITGWIDRISDPGYFLGIFSSADSFSNLSFWTHPLMQSIITKTKNAQTENEREALFKNAETLLLNEMPMVPLHSAKLISPCQSDLNAAYRDILQRFDKRFLT